MIKYILSPFITVLFLTPLCAFSQPNILPEDEVFVDDVVPRIDITVNPDTLVWLYENVESNQEFHATFVFNNGSITDTIENIGFRLRGNTSRYSAKKSFKVSFNKFEAGRKWNGLEKLNLNGEHNDPSVIRAKLCWDMVSDFGLAGSRSNHVELYINGNYHGLYINVEHIDEEFVKSRFGNNDGNLYKCLWPADLDYLGSDPDLYKVWHGDRQVYALKTNTTANDYSDIAHFIDVLNNTPDNEFACEIEKVFNINDYLKIIAIDVFTGNWDGYIYNKNNFYLYNNTETGKFEYIHYDLDNTLGIDWIGRDWGERNIYDWQQHGDNVRPLYTRVMENQELKDRYSFYFNMLITEYIVPTVFEAYANQIKITNLPYVEDDPYYPLDYGYNVDDYLDSYYEDLGGHVDYGIFPYINTRRANASFQLELNDIPPVIKYLTNNQPTPGGDLVISAFVEDEDAFPEVLVSYSVNSGSTLTKQMFDDGNHFDGEAGDKRFGAVLSNFQMNTTLEFQIVANDNAGNTSTYPCEPNVVELTASLNPKLYINEFMASNDSTIADEFDEFDDWIEIYNDDNGPVWLGEKYLSDNIDNPDKWQLPDVTLEPGEFVLIWADDDPEQGAYHTNFKLDMSGEEIGLFDSEITGYYLLDSITFQEQITDVSMGRKPDGSENWMYLTNTTPGYSNELSSTIEYQSGMNSFNVYPNPATGDKLFFDKPLSFTLYSFSGVPISTMENSSILNISVLKPGLYFIVTTKGETAKIIIK